MYYVVLPFYYWLLYNIFTIYFVVFRFFVVVSWFAFPGVASFSGSWEAANYAFNSTCTARGFDTPDIRDVSRSSARLKRCQRQGMLSLKQQHGTLDSSRGCLHTSGRSWYTVRVGHLPVDINVPLWDAGQDLCSADPSITILFTIWRSMYIVALVPINHTIIHI